MTPSLHPQHFSSTFLTIFLNIILEMATKQKVNKQQQVRRDREENRKFITIVAVATVLLMALLYFVFAR